MIEYNKRNARSWSIMGINPSIWSVAFPEIINQNDTVVAITADLARYSGMMRTMSKHLDRFVNVGIAEQNMVGIAAGLALENNQVFMTTYAPFMSYRCADQMRHLVGNLNLNIKAIGSAAGFSSANGGNSMLAISDIALMRAIPNMTVLSPADCAEAVKMIIAVSKTNTPAYIRFCGAVDLPIVYHEDFSFRIGEANLVTEGSEVAIIATGTNIVHNCMEAAKKLKLYGVSVAVYDFHTIKPIDRMCLDSIFKKYSLIVTAEEHNVIGGLGSAVAEYKALRHNAPRQVLIGVQDQLYIPGKRTFCLEQCGLTSDRIKDTIMNSIADPHGLT